MRQIKPAQLAFSVHTYLFTYLFVFVLRIRSRSKRTFQLSIVRSCFSPAASVGGPKCSRPADIIAYSDQNTKRMQKYSDLFRTLTRGPSKGSAQDPVISHRQFLDRLVSKSMILYAGFADFAKHSASNVTLVDVIFCPFFPFESII